MTLLDNTRQVFSCFWRDKEPLKLLRNFIYIQKYIQYTFLKKVLSAELALSESGFKKRKITGGCMWMSWENKQIRDGEGKKTNWVNKKNKRCFWTLTAVNNHKALSRFFCFSADIRIKSLLDLCVFKLCSRHCCCLLICFLFIASFSQFFRCTGNSNRKEKANLSFCLFSC